MILSAITNMLSPLPLFLMAASCMGGLIVGSIPGLTSTMAIALLVPLTFGMSMHLALAMLIGVYIGAISGGLVAATLLSIPGTPASASTTFDAFPMTRKGEAGKALAYGVFASFLGSLLSFFALAVCAPLLGSLAIHFSSYEYLALIIFTLTCIISISGKSLLKGMISTCIGMLLSCVGLCVLDGSSRFTFGLINLEAGLAVVPVLIGVYAMSQVLKDIENINKPFELHRADFTLKEFAAVVRTFRHSIKNVIRSSALGVGIGILPGIGPGLSNIVAYSQARDASPHPETFGTGDPDGIIASESANNAATGGALIPMLTLGIPGDASTMMLIGAFMIHGIEPGPLLFANHQDIVVTVLAAYLISNFFMLFWQVNCIRVLIKALLIPRHILYPIIVAMCVVGCFALSSNLTDVWVFAVVGLAGYFLTVTGFPILPLVLGLILGHMAERELSACWLAGDNSLWGIMDRPVALFFIAAAVFSVIYGLRGRRKRMAGGA